MLKVSTMKLNIQSYYNYITCCLIYKYVDTVVQKISQSTTIVGHLFNCHFSLKVILLYKSVNRTKEEKLTYFFETEYGCGSYRSGLCSHPFSLNHYEST